MNDSIRYRNATVCTMLKGIEGPLVLGDEEYEQSKVPLDPKVN